MHKLLAQKYREYILSQNEPVSMTYLLDRSTDKGNSMTITLKAVERLHRFTDIKKSVKGTEVYYTKIVKAPPPSLTWRIPKEDYPKATDENSADHPVFDSMNFEHLFMTPEELQIKKWKDLKEACS